MNKILLFTFLLMLCIYTLGQGNSSEEMIVIYRATELRNQPSTEGIVLCTIPSGVSLKMFSYEKPYYQVNYNDYLGFVHESSVYSEISKKQSEIKTLPTSQKKICKSYFKDGHEYQYYVYKGISVTMRLSQEQKYGKYYVAYIAIENLTGSPFTFDPKEISAAFYVNEKSIEGVVLTSEEYLRIVNNRQTFDAVLMALGETSSANQAGYSTTTEKTSTNAYYYGEATATAYYGDDYARVDATGRVYETATSTKQTETYDGSKVYAAQQNAQRKINEFVTKQYEIQKVINQGYLKLNTVEDKQRLLGQVCIKYKDASEIRIVVPVNEELFVFDWGK